MRYIIGLFLALLLSPVFSQGLDIPRQIQIPPHAQKCMASAILYQGFIMHRFGGVTHEETIMSLDISMKILEHRIEELGLEPPRPIDEIYADARAKLDEVYAIEPFDKSVVDTYALEKMDECVNAAEETMPKPSPEQRNPNRRIQRSA